MKQVWLAATNNKSCRGRIYLDLALSAAGNPVKPGPGARRAPEDQ
jgi:hypothetical protein